MTLLALRRPARNGQNTRALTGMLLISARQAMWPALWTGTAVARDVVHQCPTLDVNADHFPKKPQAETQTDDGRNTVHVCLSGPGQRRIRKG
jgi:hypothetical protein